MSGFEAFTGIVATILGSFLCFSWYADLFRVAPLNQNRGQRIVLGIVPVICCAGIVCVLMIRGSHDVRDDPFWVAYYAVLGIAWVGASLRLAELLGIDVREDVLERRNRGAFFVCVAALVSFSVCYGGGNVGEGPGAYAVTASGGVATGLQLLLWAALEWSSGYSVSERVTVERDEATVIRLSAMLLCNGLILGFAAAGDWEPDWFISLLEAAWPTLPVTILAIVVERRTQRRNPGLEGRDLG